MILVSSKNVVIINTNMTYLVVSYNTYIYLKFYKKESIPNQLGHLYFCRNQVRLRGLRLQGWRQSRCFLHWWPHPRLQLEPHQQHHLQHVRWSPRKEQEDDHHRWDVPHLQEGQGLQGHRWHPRFRWNLEIVRQERGQDHPQQGSLQAVDQSWYVVFVIFICNVFS